MQTTDYQPPGPLPSSPAPTDLPTDLPTDRPTELPRGAPLFPSDGRNGAPLRRRAFGRPGEEGRLDRAYRTGLPEAKEKGR